MDRDLPEDGREEVMMMTFYALDQTPLTPLLLQEHSWRKSRLRKPAPGGDDFVVDDDNVKVDENDDADDADDDDDYVDDGDDDDVNDADEHPPARASTTGLSAAAGRWPA